MPDRMPTTIGGVSIKKAEFGLLFIGQYQCAAAETPLGGRFIRKTKGIITRAERPSSQKLSRYAIIDACRRMDPYSCRRVTFAKLGGNGPLAAKLADSGPAPR